MPEDIRALNLHWLMVLRDLANRDPAAATHRFGAPKELIASVLRMSLEEIQKLADCDALLFAPKITSQSIQYLAAAPAAMRPALVGVSNHAAA